MIVRLFTIVALLVFVALVWMGAGMESAMLKSATVFVALVVGTKVSMYLLDIIKENTKSEQESPTHN